MLCFENPVTAETLELINRMQLGEIVAQDERTTLFNAMRPLGRHELSSLARFANQTARVEFPGAGASTVVAGVTYTRRGTRWEREGESSASFRKHFWEVVIAGTPTTPSEYRCGNCPRTFVEHLHGPFLSSVPDDCTGGKP